MPISAVDAIGPGFERMKRHLFQPFRFKEWIRLAIVGFLAGEMGSFGGCSLRFPFNIPTRPRQQFQIEDPRSILVISGIVFLVILALVGSIVLLYVSSRMRFVLFESIIAGECRIGEFWRRHGQAAARYFVWLILLMLVAVVSLVVVIAIPTVIAALLGWIAEPRAHVIAIVLCVLLVVTILFALFAALISVHVLMKDFVIPQMALEQSTVGVGWQRLWDMMKQEKGGFAGYLGMKFILTIATVVILGVLTLIALIVVLLPVGGLGFLVVLWGKTAGMHWTPLTIAIAISVGIVVVSGLIFISALISVPAIVFFPAYSIYFLADRYAPLRAVLHPSG